MMSLDDLREILLRTGLPVVYDFWPIGQAPELPWLCYRTSSSDNFFADDTVYCQISNVEIELYTAIKSPATEQQVEIVLTAAGLPWEKTEVWISAENCYQITYVIEV